MVAEAAQRKLDTLPASPGVYVFHGADEKVLYVGKARSLRSRVRSYFQPGSSDLRAFVSRLERELVDIETFVTHTDKEAALLENQLIKSRQPKYIVKLRDEVRELEDEYDDSVYDRWILEHQYRMAVARMQEHDPEGIAWLDEQVRRWESRREGFLEERRRLRLGGRKARHLS